MTVEELLLHHAVDPAALEPAPADTPHSAVIDRICAFPPRPCSVCGEPSPTARMRDFPGHGPRWVDLCRDHSITVIGPWRGPTTAEGILADLREVTAEVGLPLQVWTDTGGWQDERMPDPERYHLTLTAGGRPVMHGWWASRPTADRKFVSWVGEYGSIPGARVTLVDETTGSLLTTWPDET